MPGFPLQLTQAEDEAIAKLSTAVGMKKRPWVMMLIHRAIAAAAEPPPPKAWMFKLKGGEIKRGAGEDMAQAWYGLGYTMADIELIDERLPEKEAIEAGWMVKAPVEDVGLPFGQ